MENVPEVDVYEEGRVIRYNARFNAVGTNVTIVARLSENSIYVRTYERGVEDETLSCGTGVTAAALVTSMGGAQSPVTVKTPGGELKVQFERSGDGFKYIYLIGPAKLVFSGSVTI